MIDRAKDINQKINETLSKQSFNMQDVQTLAMCWGALQTLGNAPATIQEKELTDVFPALSMFQYEHNVVNFQKLCVEIEEFCRVVYAGTQNDLERKIYQNMISRLNDNQDC